MATVKKKMYPKVCSNCGYRWFARIENPKSCPACKHRFDYEKFRRQATIRKSRR